MGLCIVNQKNWSKNRLFSGVKIMQNIQKSLTFKPLLNRKKYFLGRRLAIPGMNIRGHPQMMSR